MIAVANEKFGFHENCACNACRTGQQPPTRMISNIEVEAVANGLWRATAILPPEPLGPPCARCGMDHATGSNECLIRERVVTLGSSLSADSLDSLLRHIARDVHAAACSELPRPYLFRTAMPNTCWSVQLGEHWFACAWSVEAVPILEPMDTST